MLIKNIFSNRENIISKEKDLKKLIIVALLVMAVLMSGCGSSGSSDSDSDGDGTTTSWTLQSDGSWKSGSTTLAGTTGAYIAQLDKAPAAGGQPSGVTAINASSYTYTNTTGSAKTVIIKTTGGNLTINAPLDTVYHYGDAGTVTIEAVASMSYDGHANIGTSLTVKKGHIKLTSDIADTIPLISVPADATGAVDIEIPAGVVVDDVTVASGEATSIDIAGSVATITAPATTSIDVSGDVETVSGGAIATVSGDGYVEDRGDGNSTGNPISIGNTGYTTLAEAVTAANAGDTIKLKGNITVTATAGIISKDDITLDLNGKTITYAPSYATSGDYIELLNVTGTLTITGNGTITGPTGSEGAKYDSKVMISVEGDSATLTMIDGSMTAGGEGSDGMYGIYALTGGNIILGASDGTGPSITTWFAPVGMNNTTATAKMHISGGTYTQEADPGSTSTWWHYFCAPVYAACAGEYTITGGTFNGFYAFSSRYKTTQTINISGGTFNGSQADLFIGTVEAKNPGERTWNITGGDITTGELIP